MFHNDRHNASRPLGLRRTTRIVALTLTIMVAGNQVIADAPPPPQAPAAPPTATILQTLPANEWGSLMLANPTETAQRLDEFYRAMGINAGGIFGGGFRQTATMAFGYLGMGDTVRQDAPIGLIAPGNAGEAENGRGNLQWERLVFAMPVKSRAEFAKKSGISDAIGQVEPLPKERPLGQLFSFTNSLVTMGAHHAIIAPIQGENDEALAHERALRSAKGKRLVEVLPADVTSALSEADLLFHLGVASAIAEGREDLHFPWDDINREFPPTTPQETELRKEIAAALTELQHLFVALSTRDGMKLSTRLQFEAGPDARFQKLMQPLLPKPGSPEATTGATLAHLPHRKPVAALSAITIGERQQRFIQMMSQMTTEGAGRWQGILSQTLASLGIADLRQAVLLGLFSEVVDRSDSVKLAVYPNPDGTFGIIVILNAKDPAESIAALKDLSDLLVHGLGESDPDKPVLTDAQIRSLVRQLASDDFAIRTRANTRLLLVGRQGLPELEKFRNSENQELAVRVKQIIATLSRTQQEQEKTLLSGNLLANIHPRLTYHVASETVANRSVDVIRLSLPEKEQVYEQQLEAILGKQWNQVRVTNVDRSVVVTLGTVGPLLEETLNNLTTGNPGLEANMGLVQLPVDPHRMLLLHLPIGRLIEPSPDRNFNAPWIPTNLEPTAAMTAVGISASLSGLWTDLHIPVDEARLILGKRAGGFW
ncbi:MAG: hypothetical protein R3C01_14950 [Planctomycetaceae bacterium]